MYVTGPKQGLVFLMHNSADMELPFLKRMSLRSVRNFVLKTMMRLVIFHHSGLLRKKKHSNSPLRA